MGKQENKKQVMDMREKYKSYWADDPITVTKRELYTDSEGFPNEVAFLHYIKTLTPSDKFLLACINIDLRASNQAKGYAFGTLVLRKAVLQLQDFFAVFRVSGEKFNLLIPEEELEDAKRMLDNCPNTLFTIYYGISTKDYVYSENIEMLRRDGIDLMFAHKAKVTGKKHEEVRDDKIIGDKGNTPAQLQETDTHKCRDTMWWGVIDLEEIQPFARNVKAYVFPTEYKDKKMSLNQIVVIDDLVNTRILTGNNVTFGFDGIKFSVSTRFDENGKLSVLCFKDRESKGQVEMNIQLHEGNCIPASFGKRLDSKREIFPIKQVASGGFSYVLFDRSTNTVTYDETGLVEVDGKRYAVYVTENSIDLISQ